MKSLRDNGVLIGISLALLAAGPNIPSKKPNARADKGGIVDTTKAKPFGLSETELKKAKLFLAGYSPKTGAGVERIEIFGTGEVRLIRTINYEAPEETVTAKVKDADVAALFSLMEAEGFLTLEYEYKDKSNHSLRSHISLTLPSGEKSVYADVVIAPPEFNRMAGSIKMLAATASPLVYNHQFFFRL